MADWTFDEVCDIITELQGMQARLKKGNKTPDKVLHYLAAAEGDLTQVRELLEPEKPDVAVTPAPPELIEALDTVGIEPGDGRTFSIGPALDSEEQK